MEKCVAYFDCSELCFSWVTVDCPAGTTTATIITTTTTMITTTTTTVDCPAGNKSYKTQSHWQFICSTPTWNEKLGHKNK